MLFPRRMAINMNANTNDAPAGEFTPSIPQYFTWINNNNEGSNEAQTLINLDFFGFMQREYGMRLEIYALDAGNLDSPGDGYASLDSDGRVNSPYFYKQFPNGFDDIVKKAAGYGISLGIWGGPDGFGDSDSEAAGRRELLVSLCRDYGFRLFKFDAVCGALRPEKAELFAEAIDECRRFSPGLILLIHRLDLHGFEDRATTFLWKHNETYIDVMYENDMCAPHHRAGTIARGLTDSLSRRYEDHGVCISSCIDGWDDDLVAQAFGRCLILAPEIYGNPWLLRDDEYPILGRIFALHYRWRSILVNGIALDEDSYGRDAVSRGDGRRRFVLLKNLTWTAKKVALRFDELGLERADKVELRGHHPYEEYLGVFGWEDNPEIEVRPFRVCLVELSETGFDEDIIAGAPYHRLGGGKYRVYGAPYSEAALILCPVSGGKATFVVRFDGRGSGRSDPVYLGRMSECIPPSDSDMLYESTAFSASSDSLERSAANRAGESAFPEVSAARDAFFAQESYKAHGCESAFLFDGREDTFFDGCSLQFDQRIEGGALRIDCGGKIAADTLELDCFVPDEDEINAHRELFGALIPREGYAWSCTADYKKGTLRYIGCRGEYKCEKSYINMDSERVARAHGCMRTLVYGINGCAAVRYISLPCPPDRIFAARFLRNRKVIELPSPRASNLLADRTLQTPKKALSLSISRTAFAPDGNIAAGSRLCVALEGSFGSDLLYCAARQGDKYIGSDDRAPSYPVNFWSWKVMKNGSRQSVYIPLDGADARSDIELFALSYDDSAVFDADVRLVFDQSRVYSQLDI